MVRFRVNGYWGHDCCGAWFYFDHLESTTRNNHASDVINESTYK